MVLLGWLMMPFLSILVLSSIVTGIFKPLYLFLCKKIPAVFASVLTCFVIFVLLFVPMIFFVGVLSNEAYGLYSMGKDAILSDQLTTLLKDAEIPEKINPFLIKFNIQITMQEVYGVISDLGKFVGLYLYKQASAVASNTLRFLVNFFFMLVVVYFFLIDGDRLVDFIVKLSPLPKDQDEMLIQKFKNMSGAIIVFNGICGVIQGTLGGIVFAIFGLQSPILWGVIMGILAFLPIVGIGLVFIPAAFILMLKGKIGESLFFLVFYAFLSGSVEYLVKPRLVGDKVKMHPLMVIFSIIGGLQLFGILGIIYGPLIAIAFLTLSDIYYSNYQIIVEPDCH